MDDIIDKYLGKVSLKDVDIIRMLQAIEKEAQRREISIYEHCNEEDTKSYINFIKN